MGALNKNSTIEELCTWLKGAEGSKFLDMLDKFGDFIGTIATSVGAMKKVSGEFKDLHDILSKVKGSKPLGAKVYSQNLKSVAETINKGWKINPKDADEKEKQMLQFLKDNGGERKFEYFVDQLDIVFNIVAGVDFSF